MATLRVSDADWLQMVSRDCAGADRGNSKIAPIPATSHARLAFISATPKAVLVDRLEIPTGGVVALRAEDGLPIRGLGADSSPKDSFQLRLAFCDFLVREHGCTSFLYSAVAGFFKEDLRLLLFHLLIAHLQDLRQFVATETVPLVARLKVEVLGALIVFGLKALSASAVEGSSALATALVRNKASTTTADLAGDVRQDFMSR